MVLAACSTSTPDDPATTAAEDDATEETTATEADDQPADDEPAELTPVSVVAPNPAVLSPWYPVYVADHLGYFEEEGLEVTVNSVEGTPPSVQGLASGQADVVPLATASFIPAGLEQDEFSPVMFYLTSRKSPFDLQVPEDSDIQEAADLEGRVIGVQSLDNPGAITARALMGTAGLQPDEDYEFLTVGDIGQAVAAFERGDIDAWGGALIEVAVLEARGISMRTLAPEEFQTRIGFGMWATQDFIDSNPETISGFSRAVARATETIGGDAEQLVDVIAEIRPDQVEERDVGLRLAELMIDLLEVTETETFGMIDEAQFQVWWDNLVNQEAITPSDDDSPTDFYTNEFVPES